MSARLERLKARLEKYCAAEDAILEGDQSWSSPDGMTYKRGDLYTIQRKIESLESAIAAIDGSGSFVAQTVSFQGRR